MRLRVDQQLFLSYLILIGALTIAISIGAGAILRADLLRTVEDDLARELNLAREAFESHRGAPVDSIADLLGRLSGRRITIITPDGVAIGESAMLDADRPAAGDYGSRPEVREAIDRGTGRGIRFSSTLGADYLYLAVATSTGDVIRAAVELEEIEEAVSSVRRRVFALGGVALGLAALFSLAFSVFVTRPLRHTVEVARVLGSGDLSRRVTGIRDNDVGDLGAALNALADQSQKRMKQLDGERAEMQTLIDSMSEGVLAVSPNGLLRRSNPAARRIFSLGSRSEGIPPEMVSRRPDFLALVARAMAGESVAPVEIIGDGQHLLGSARPLPHGGAVIVILDISELRRLEDVRRDFVANASHELKTPLTAIRGYSETLLDPDLPPDLARRFAEIVKANSDRLQRIVDDLLDLSRIEAGGWRVEPEPVEVGTLARSVWEAEASSSKQKLIELVIDTAPGHDWVRADPGALRQVFANLFNNAVRYTSAGGSVTVRTRSGNGPKRGDGGSSGEGDEWTVVEVVDSGTGMSRVHLSRIFERFYRVDPARSREEGGTGLGLAIVKHLIEAHGGSIEADSEVGKGTTIRFTLPGHVAPDESSGAEYPRVSRS